MTDVFRFVYDFLTSQEYCFRAAFLLEAFKWSVINAFKVCFRADDALVIRVEYNDIGVKANRQLTLVFKTVYLCRCSREQVYKSAS